MEFYKQINSSLVQYLSKDFFHQFIVVSRL